MFLRVSEEPVIENLQQYPSRNVADLRDLLVQGAPAKADRQRKSFYEVEDNFTQTRAPHLPEGKERAKFADASKAHRDIYSKGFSLVASREGRVFDMAGESERLKEEYGAAGTGANNFGRGCLLARH